MMNSDTIFLIGYARRHLVWVCAALVLDFAGAIFNGVGTTLIIPVLLGLSGSPLEAERFPAAIGQILQIFDPLPPQQRAIGMIAAIAIAISLKNIANYAGTISNAKLSQGLTRDMREDGLQLLLDVDLDYHHKMKSGDIIQRINDQVARTTGATRALIRLVRIVFNISLFGILLVLISWQLTATTVVLMGGVVLVNQNTIQRSRRFGRSLAESSKQYSIALLELLSGMRLVRGTANESREYQKLRRLIRAREQAALASQANAARIGPTNEISSIFVLILIVLAGRVIFADRADALGATLLTYLFLLSRLIPFLGQLNTARSEIANSSASIAVVREFLDRSVKPFMPKGEIPYRPLQQGIEFQDLWFRYPETEASVLNGITLSLPRGTTLALVGSSGAGKSTLADLLPRFYDPDRGRILIDGQDLKSLDLHSVRSHMGIVSQETFLFNASIRDNIAYARPDATDQDIFDAARRANALEFIEKMPQGFSTPIGDRGVLLSGGQRQRLSIARALLQDPDILILDEATSALDTVSERLVQQALDDLSRDRTTLVIAHRLSTIQDADQIAVLDKGSVLEVGTHQELLARGEAYARLYAMQFRENPQQIAVEEISRSVQRSSHQMRTRLSSVLGTLQLLADDLLDSLEEQQDLTEEAYNDALRLLQTIEDLEKEVASYAPEASSYSSPETAVPVSSLNAN